MTPLRKRYVEDLRLKNFSRPVGCRDREASPRPCRKNSRSPSGDPKRTRQTSRSRPGGCGVERLSLTRPRGTLSRYGLSGTPPTVSLRKEVIQPQVLLRLPCYDLVPVIGLTVVASALAVRSAASGTPDSHGLTGGVYKAQEHIHRGIADPRLLAIPTSWSRVADSNLNWGRFSPICSTSRSCFGL